MVMIIPYFFVLSTKLQNRKQKLLCIDYDYSLFCCFNVLCTKKMELQTKMSYFTLPIENFLTLQTYPY